MCFRRIIAIFLLFHLTKEIYGHGRLIEPPSRASAWRYGFQTPPNYNDHELYCGGFTRQWIKNDGRCGECGDAWDLPKPRPHEFGGVYGKGVIVRKYSYRTTLMVRVELTANHFGHFEFRLCDNHLDTSQECFNRHLLQVVNYKMRNTVLSNSNNQFKFYPKEGSKIYEIRYRLPNVTCTHCVLQWIYKAGNNWGRCPNGTEAVGCGPQEEFRACADISVTSSITTPTIKPHIPSSSTTEFTSPKPTTNYPETFQKDFTSLYITILSLFLVLVLLGILYLYFYQFSKNVKSCLKSDLNDKIVNVPKIPPPPKRRAPLPPSGGRNIHTSDFKYQEKETFNTSSNNESVA